MLVSCVVRSSAPSSYSSSILISPSSSVNLVTKAKMKEKAASGEILTCSPYAYDGIKILAQVMKEVGTDKAAIKDELYKVSYTGGVSGDTIGFDENGSVTGASYVIATIKEGVAEMIEYSGMMKKDAEVMEKPEDEVMEKKDDTIEAEGEVMEKKEATE